MRSTHFEIPGIGRVDVHCNTDWSGDAIVCWGWKPAIAPRFEGDGDYEHEVGIPAAILIALAGSAAVDFVASAVMQTLEDLDLRRFTLFRRKENLEP